MIEVLSDYYIIEFVYEEKSYYSLWNEESSNLIKQNRKIVVGDNKKILIEEFGECASIHDEGDIYICNLEIINMTPGKILDFWNIISDVAKTVDINFLGDSKHMNILYDKLYRNYTGQYVGVSDVEIINLKHIVLDGIRIIKKYIVNNQ